MDELDLLLANLQQQITDKDEWIKSIVDSTLDKLDYTKLSDVIVVEFNGRFTQLAGRAKYRDNKIELSTKLWEVSSEDQRRETVVHETCHIVVRNQFGSAIQSHGYEWRSAMIKCGYYNPQRCHTIDRQSIPRQKRRKYRYGCRCGDSHVIGAVRHSRIANNKATYRCKRCRQTIVYIGRIS